MTNWPCSIFEKKIGPGSGGRRELTYRFTAFSIMSDVQKKQISCSICGQPGVNSRSAGNPGHPCIPADKKETPAADKNKTPAAKNKTSAAETPSGDSSEDHLALAMKHLALHKKEQQKKKKVAAKS
ncbi:MAG: hypothetical protein CMB73_02635 [Euryarchaeota archaeon]|nr:hypothetical protein [Euryarchaeota archaeon]